MAATKRKVTSRKATVKKTASKAKVKPKATATAKRKPAVKKTAVNKKTPVKKAKIVKAPKLNIKTPLKKTELIRTLAELADLQKKDVVAVLDSLTNIMTASLNKKGPEQFIFLNLFKVLVVHKKAKPAKKGINPFTGEPTIFKAKPASKGLKVRTLKAMKEMVK